LVFPTAKFRPADWNLFLPQDWVLRKKKRFVVYRDCENRMRNQLGKRSESAENWNGRYGGKLFKAQVGEAEAYLYDECIKEPSWWFIYFVFFAHTFCPLPFFFFCWILGFLEASAIAINEMKRTTTSDRQPRMWMSFKYYQTA